MTHSEALEKHENGTIQIDEIVVSGGMAQKNALLVRLLSDMTRKRVIVPECQETVLLGNTYVTI
jgi:ribulose kinase